MRSPSLLLYILRSSKFTPVGLEPGLPQPSHCVDFLVKLRAASYQPDVLLPLVRLAIVFTAVFIELSVSSFDELRVFLWRLFSGWLL